jgi:hypothetical protein
MSAIRDEVDRYLEERRLLRSANWQRDNRYILRKWAAEIGCETLQELTTPALQTWFNAKLGKVKVQSAAAYLYQVVLELVREGTRNIAAQRCLESTGTETSKECATPVSVACRCAKADR